MPVHNSVVQYRKRYMMTTKQKSRYFAFILYTESIPEDWILKLEALDISMAISPLHDKDKNEDGNYKKPHYHVMYVAKNPVTIEAIRNRIKRTLGNNSISYVEIIDSMKNYYQYLTHESKDAITKKKQRYDVKEIITINGFDIDRYVTLDDAQKNEVLDITIGLTLKYGFKNIVDFMDFYFEHADDYGLPNLRLMNDIIKSNTGILRLYFDGNYQRHQREIMKDKEKRDQK